MDAILNIRPNPVSCPHLELSLTVSALLADLHSLVPPLDLSVASTLSQALLCQPWEGMGELSCLDISLYSRGIQTLPHEGG